MDIKKLIKNIFFQVMGFFCSTGISLFLVPFIVGKMGEETYGFVGLANNFTSYITLFTIALNGMVSRYITIEYCRNNKETASGFFSTAIISQIVLGILLFIPMMLFAGNLEKVINISDSIVLEVKILWVLLFISFLLDLPSASLNAAPYLKNRLDITALISMISNIIRTSVILLMFLFFPTHIWYVGFATLIAEIFTITAKFVSKKRLVPDLNFSKKKFNFSYIKELLLVGIWNALNRLQQILVTGLDLLLTNIFINSTEMGLLSIAKTLPGQVSTLFGTVSSAFEPPMTITYSNGNMDDFVKQVEFAMKLGGFLCSVPIIGIICFGYDFYSLWVPTLSKVNLLKIQICSILTMLPEIFSVYIFPLYSVNTITTKLKVPVLISLAIGILNIFIVFILLKITNLGIYAVAGVSSVLWVFRILIFVPTYAAYSLGIKLSTFYSTLIRGLFNSVILLMIMMIVSKLFVITSWQEFIIICGMTGLISYLCTFVVLFNKNERRKVVSIIKLKITKKHN